MPDSPPNNAFAHFVMLSLLFSGFDPEGTEVKMDGVELWRAHAIESFDTGVVTFRNRQGVRLWFGVSHTSHEALEPEIVLFKARDAKEQGWVGQGTLWMLQANDCRATCKELAARGVKIISEPQDYPWGTAATVEDLYGNPFNVLTLRG